MDRHVLSPPPNPKAEPKASAFAGRSPVLKKDVGSCCFYCYVVYLLLLLFIYLFIIIIAIITNIIIIIIITIYIYICFFFGGGVKV